MTTLLSLSQVSLSAWQQALGRFHVVVVHLPIALLLVAAVIEFFYLVFRRPKPNQTSLVCIALGAGTAVVAAVLGYFHAHYSGLADSPDNKLLEQHELTGYITAAIAVVAALAALPALKFRKFLLPFRLATIASAILVGYSGHLGGAMTHGEGYLTELLFPETPVAETAAEPSPSSESSTDSPTTEPATTEPSTSSARPPLPKDAVHGAVSEFEQKVRPILAKACFECHGPAKHSASLRLDTVAEIYKGSKSGPVIAAGKSAESLLIKRVTEHAPGKKRMPPDRPPLSSEQIATLRAWIDRDTTAPQQVVKRWAPVIEPVRPKIGSGVDVILSKYYGSKDITPAPVVDDRTYARRVFFDTVGMLPTPDELNRFLADTSPDKRPKLVKTLLADNRRYAENWLSFWNDALRNDYKGTGYIDGGRLQITAWLFSALEKNLPYDQFVAQLINPVPGSEGFVKGIVWRGTVSESQRPEMQAAQNISQVFLGVNMKCASCHDSFINDWKLADAYGLAAIYADKPLQMFRCEKETGQISQAKFLYPQLGTIDAAAPKPQRMQQLAGLMTSKDNGRLARTIVNRLWARFMGRGLVEPVDEMDNEPWNADLLDWLAVDLMDHGYDLKHTIAQILTSQAYQLPAQPMADPSESAFTFRGPVVRRLSAEQFCDAVSQVTGYWNPSASSAAPGADVAPAKFIWLTPDATTTAPGGTVYFRKVFNLPAAPASPGDAVFAAMADNRVTVYLNGRRINASNDWAKPTRADIGRFLRPGRNVITAAATNDPVAAAPTNPAAFWATFSVRLPETSSSPETLIEIGTDETWDVTDAITKDWANPNRDKSTKWTKAHVAKDTGVYNLPTTLAALGKPYMLRRYRAAWAANDPLMTALGRPNREQVVTYRPTAATTLQALELTNGSTLADILKTGGQTWSTRTADSPQSKITALYQTTLSRPPTEAELKTATDLLGTPATPEGLEDLIWSLLMLPEFQLIH